ncbi:MAG: AAA family ATPase [Paludibacteraceae bacterium]
MKYKRYLITGGPGTGKTTLINQLNQMNFVTKDEAARSVIELNMANNGKVLPWLNRDLFDDNLIDIFRNDYFQITENTPVFYDGGALDILAWRKYLNLDNKRFEYLLTEFEYENKVFIPIPWKEIYVQDEIRPFTFLQAVEITETIIQFYRKIGYETILLPKLSPIKRAEYVIDTISKKNYT